MTYSMRQILLPAIFLLISFSQILAQGEDHYESSSKIFTVVACVAVILIGIVIFLFFIERRVSKMEQHYDQLE